MKNSCTNEVLALFGGLFYYNMGVEVNERLKTLLKRKGISQRELAKATGITPAQISRYLSGARLPRGEALVTLSNYFEVTTDYLLGYEAKALTPYEKVLEAIDENKSELTSEEKMDLIMKLSSK